MLNFTGGLIKTPSCYINPNSVVNFCEDNGTTLVSYTDETVGELEDVSSKAFAEAFVEASNTGKIVNVIV